MKRSTGRWSSLVCAAALLAWGASACSEESQPNDAQDATVDQDADDVASTDASDTVDVVPQCPESCDDHNPCTADDCNPETGLCTYVGLTEGTECDDKDPCTVGDTCDANSYCQGVAKTCDDWNTCTADECQPVSGECLFLPVAGPCDEPQPAVPLHLGPYLQWAIQTEATVMWETTTECSGALLLKNPDGSLVRFSEETPRTIHEFTLSNLTPDTDYTYRIRACADDAPIAQEWTFHTFPEQADTFTYAVWGDSQDNPSVLTKLAGMMWTAQIKFAMVVGDVVEHGSIYEEWKELLFDSIAVFSPYIPFFPALGNHEENAEWYYNYYHLPNTELYYAFTYGDARFMVLDSIKAYSTLDPEGAWIAQETASEAWTKAKYRFVFFHVTPITNLWGPTGLDGDAFIRNILMPQIRDKKVDVLFTGHAHCYERGYLPEGDGMYLVITGGGGGGLDYEPSGEWPEITVAWSENNYTKVEVTPEKAVVTAIALDGGVLDTFDVIPREQTLP